MSELSTSIATSIATLLNQGEAVGVATRGKSMLPLLREGKSEVLLEPVDRELAVGDMPVYIREDGAYILHRVVGIDESNYYIRGDNCVNLERVPKGDVLGVVVEMHRNGRTLRTTDWRYRLYVRLLMATEKPRLLLLRLRAKAGRAYRRHIKGRAM